MAPFLTAVENGPGLSIILWFQSWRTDLITGLFQPFNWAGGEIFFLVLLTIIYWTISKPVGRRLTIIFLVSTWLNAFCKSWWKRPRPFQVSGKVQAPYTAAGYGLPSGHTQTATTVASVLFAETRKRWALVLLFLYMFLMGISRMVHGVHFPQDVLLGWILGVGIVVIMLALEGRFSSALSALTLGQTLLIAIGVAAIPVGLALAVESQPQRIAGMITPAAVLAGVIPGFHLEREKVGFDISGRLAQKYLRYMVGIATALVIKEGLKPILGIINDHSLCMEITVRFIRYFLLGLWISVGAPWLFVKVKLASRESEYKKQRH